MSDLQGNTDNQDINEDKDEDQKAQEPVSKGESHNPADQDGGDPGKGGEGDEVENNDREQTKNAEYEIVEREQNTGPTADEQNNENVSKEQDTAQIAQTSGEETTMSVVISEPDRDVKTEKTTVQTVGRESPVGKHEEELVGSPVKQYTSLNQVIESQSESDSPLVAPPTSQAEKSIDSITPAASRIEFPRNAKDGFSANGRFLSETI